MNSLDDDLNSGILKTHGPPCLSLYQPTHRSHPQNQQDPIRFGNLVRTLEESLSREFATSDIESLLQPFHSLAADSDFWNRSLDGLAVMGAPGFFRVYKLHRPVQEIAIVADSFHVKPLLRIVQSADRYNVLGLSQHEVKLFEGNRDGLDRIDLVPEAKQSIEETMIDAAAQAHPDSAHPGAITAAAAEGHGRSRSSVPESELADRNRDRFFRAVDRAILEHYSRPSGLPLILAALPEHHAAFRKISHNPMLMAEAIDFFPDSKSIPMLRERAWRVFEPRYLTRLAGFVEKFGTARSNELGTDILAEAMTAAGGGRVATLLVEADRRVPGRFDAATGAIELDELANPEVDDLLDDLAETVLKNGGEVVVVPGSSMPTRTGLAAIYRF